MKVHEAVRTRIIIVDDHPLFREGLKALIGRSDMFSVVGEAGCAKEAFDLARQENPGIMLVDISMPGKSGIQFIRELHKVMPDVRFIIISMHANADYIVEAFQAGASGYMVKDSASEGLLRGLETVARGEVFLDSALSGEVVEKLLKARADDQGMEDDPYQSLTSREQEIMRLLAEGLMTREIAKKLFISPKTVENHRANLMKKLNLSSAIELVRYSARLGLIDLDTWAS
ncbi:MAG: response regulator transcription factor [Proteobacteria bacterium]|nr:response regulator transcription factor [Pseudomonadota bacterium]